MSSVHICWSKGHYLGQVRGFGCRRWRTVTGRCKTSEAALSKAVAKMKGAKRARSLFIDDNPYYDPHVSAEAARR